MLAYNPQWMHHPSDFYIDFYLCLSMFYICIYVSFLPQKIYVKICMFGIGLKLKQITEIDGIFPCYLGLCW